MGIINTQAVANAKKVLTGKNGALYNAKGKLLATMETYQAQVNVTNTKFQPLGDPQEHEIFTSYGQTLTFTEIVVEDGEFITDLLAGMKSGEMPSWNFQGVIKGRNGSEERLVYNDCVPSGNIDLQNVTVGDLIKRQWSLFVNGAVNQQGKLRAYLNAAEASGRITKRQNEHYKDLASQAIRNQKANDLMTSLDFENNTLGGTYGDLIATNQGKTKKSMGNEVDYLKNYLNNQDMQSLYDHLNMFGADYAQQGGGWKFLQSGDQNALEKVWEAMKPDADSMRGLVDEYVKVGQDVPKQIMDKFNETMAIGAASGDTSAAWDVYAKSIADSGDKALIDAVSQMDANGQLGEEFSAAWKRATASVTGRKSRYNSQEENGNEEKDL